MEKRPFVTNEQIQEIVKKYPTPFPGTKDTGSISR